MKLAHFDAAAGASGDMILGALVDAGVDFEWLREQLAGLAVEGYALSAEPVTRRGLAATQVKVELAEQRQPHRHLRHVVEILDASHLDETVRTRAKAVFSRLAEAEARVHRTTVERVHFHEVGAVDAIVDIVGACLGLQALGIERLSCSPLPVSHGWVNCAHGRMPVPAPATAELLCGVPTRPLDVEGETLTPTGAAILTTLVDSFEQPAMTITRVGCGAGSKDFGIPNILRLMVGEGATQPLAVVVIEANLDDMNPEWYERAVERLFAAGALDVTLSPLQMKKGRPGVLLRVLAEPAAREALSGVVLRETTTLGLRWYEAQRECLAREWREVATPFGLVRVKIGMRGGEILNLAPEYESCRAVAEAADTPLPAVYAAAREAARLALTSPQTKPPQKAN
ncbi:MAG: nickel pincer cofactor biosynthesis protein LarC [Armatimonadetes bacterium]|nr:nickel pincer cofactor biosynthesis protein LarC [Armatimonadota bacterium]